MSGPAPASGGAPVALFAYARLDHLRRTVESLSQNSGAANSDLIVFSDAARNETDAPAVNAVRDYLQQIDGFRSVDIIERDRNLGLAGSIIDGVSRVLQTSPSVIVLEDDMVTSPHFLRFMNEGLARFESDDRVASIHGYVYPVRDALPEAFFLPGGDCWGWATWRRAWSYFDEDGAGLLAALERQGLLDYFDYWGSFPYVDMLKAQVRGEADSWAIRWYAALLLAGKLTLYPGRSLVDNIGNDRSGTHASDNDAFAARLSDEPIRLEGIPVEPDERARRAFATFLRRQRPGLMGRLRRLLAI